jgi:membrane-associated phospholipid phosphatase
VTHRVGFVDPILVAASTIGTFGAVWLACAAVIAFERRRPEIVLVVAAGVWAADLLALAGKLLTDRPRPYTVNPDPAPLMRTPLDLSFPSGHAATSFAGAALLAWYAPRLAVPLYALAAVIACSRVYVGVHYPLDVLAGALLGLLVARALRWLLADRLR